MKSSPIKMHSMPKCSTIVLANILFNVSGVGFALKMDMR
jgi:hypothetical protein